MTLAHLQTFPNNAYGPKAARIEGVKRTYPSSRGWGSGWPDCQGAKIVRIEANRIGGLRMRSEIAELVALLIKASNAMGYDIRKTAEPDGGIGGFFCRAIKHSDPAKPSWHSWGLAVDQNSKANSMSTSWHSVVPPAIVKLWESAGFFWGGRYPVPPWYYDPMHFEYLFSPADVAKDIDNAKTAFEQLSGLATLYPTQWADENIPAMVRVVQFRLNAHGHSPALVDDGTWGDDTEGAVRDYQKAHGLVVDGIVGPITWGSLNAG